MPGNWKVLLPKTKFPLRVDPVKHEPAIQKSKEFEGLYRWQLENRPVEKTFTLHDGPPFANGEPHVGHVLNKVLKDIMNRYKLMKGFRIHYRPGWDCHGLPIELKACQNMPQGSSALETRNTAKSFAIKAIKFQKKAFLRWGLIGDWENPYITMSKEYESNQIDVFYRMYKQGCIYRGYKPVYWSPSSATALAEAELEYCQHSSRSVYVLFKTTCPSLHSYSSELHSLVWTTTPWTLPANKAICFHPNHSYCLVKQLSSGRIIILGCKRFQALGEILGPCEVITEFLGAALEDAEYFELFDCSAKLPFLPADHVSSEEGTGLVHTAPAHGFEDYGIGLKHNLDMKCLVNSEGQYQPETGAELTGLEVLSSGNEAVIRQLKENNILVHESAYTHRYPYDWRSKQPVIIRSTRQWFASVKSLEEGALQALSGVRGVPTSAVDRMRKMLEGRQDWCISRQRVWGVPIPVFLPREEKQQLVEGYLMSDESIDHIRKLFATHGSNCWWSLPVEQLLPPSLRQLSAHYSKGQDTMDVWFDSGSSWASVLPDGIADLYLEGTDQYRGWFQSSLLTSVAAQGKSPYKQVVSHGFVLDTDGTKMSKSLGNVISPEEIINKKKFGVDALRLWVISSDFTSDVAISEKILEHNNDFLQKLRNTFRFMLGNLTGFDSVTDIVPYATLPPLDCYQLYQLHSCYSIAHNSYDTMTFSKLYHALVNFVPRELSAFYFDIIKDRLYCDAPRGLSRRSALTVLHYHLVYLLTCLGPVLPHLAEEVASYYPLQQGTRKRTVQGLRCAFIHVAAPLLCVL